MVKVTGQDKAKQRIAALTSGAELIDEINTALFKAGNLIQTTAQKSITDGAVSGKFHVVSLPGHPPKADTHTLDRQIETALVEPLKVEVSSNAPYSAYLEYGTSRMEARPFMGPAARLNRKEAIALVKSAVRRAIIQHDGGFVSAGELYDVNTNVGGGNGNAS